jgi:hypothetical protein
LLVARPLPPLARPFLLVVVDTSRKSLPYTSSTKLAPLPLAEVAPFVAAMDPTLSRSSLLPIVLGEFGFLILALNTHVLLSDF